MVGQVFLERYEAIRLLGEGGMGRVYLARHLEMDTPYVVKVMHEHIANNPSFRERFKREIRLMARFKHPNAVVFQEASLDGPHGPFLVMEYLPGIGLDRLIARHERFTPTRLHRFLKQLCDVLHAAHAAGIYHLDLKPANLMLLDADTPQELIKVMDFGLAQIVDRPSEGDVKRTVRLSQAAVGTPGYMSPEQVHGGEVDGRADIYSIGVILYQMLAGRLPFPGTTVMEILMAQAQAVDGPPSFASLGVADRVPPGVEDAIRSALALEPAQRPATAADFFDAYDAALSVVFGRSGTGSSTTVPAAPPLLEADPNETQADIAAAAPTQTDATVEQLEAFMPEQIATYKLRGFVQEVGGKIIENRAGLIRVQLKINRKALSGKRGLLAWLGLGSKYGLMEMELHMRKKGDARNRNVVEITVMMRPGGGGPLPDNPDWRRRCGLITQQLRSYLMSQAGA
jgi:serine/threonine protein kinase